MSPKPAYLENKTILSLLMILLLVANLISRTVTEYGFTFFVILLIVLAIKKIDGLTLKKLFPLTGFDWLFLAWPSVLIITHLINGNLHEHEISEIGEYRWLLGLYFFSTALLLTDITEKITGIFFSIVSALCVVFIVDYFLHPQFPGVVGYPNRMVGFLFSPTDFAHTMQFLFLGAFCLFALPQKNRSNKTFYILGITCAFTAVTLLLSHTRAVLLACIICAIVLTGYIGRKYLLALLTSTIAACVLLYSTNIFGFRDRVNFSFTPSQTYASERMYLWKAHVRLVKDNPIFGVGYHHNQLSLRPYYDQMGLPPGTLEAHAHNQILNIWAGTGIFGVLCYLGIMFSFIRLSIKNIQSFEPRTFLHNLAITSLVLLCAFLIAGLTDTNFELIAPKYYLLFTWSIILYQSKVASKRLDKATA